MGRGGLLLCDKGVDGKDIDEIEGVFDIGVDTVGADTGTWVGRGGRHGLLLCDKGVDGKGIDVIEGVFDIGVDTVGVDTTSGALGAAM